MICLSDLTYKRRMRWIAMRMSEPCDTASDMKTLVAYAYITFPYRTTNTKKIKSTHSKKRCAVLDSWLVVHGVSSKSSSPLTTFCSSYLIWKLVVQLICCYWPGAGSFWTITSNLTLFNTKCRYAITKIWEESLSTQISAEQSSMLTETQRTAYRVSP